MLGGRAAEEIVYGTRTTGAENDIEQATGLARQMVTRWGMSEKLGMVQLAPRQNNWVGPAALPGPSPTAKRRPRLIDMEVARIMQECHEEAKRLLGEHRVELDALVAALMSGESLDEKEILEATGLPPAPPLPDRPKMPDRTAKGSA